MCNASGLWDSLKRATLLGLLLLVFGTVPVAAQQEEIDVEEVLNVLSSGMGSADGIKVAIAIKGGGSLGAYEAGVNWGLLRFLKKFRDQNGNRPELIAAAGASAGAFNGVMSAVYWCGVDLGYDTIEKNLIGDSWRSIDVVDLLDTGTVTDDTLYASKGLYDGPCAEEVALKDYSALDEDNAVFSRRIFRRTEDTLICLMNRPVFEPNCSVSIGLTLTRAEPVRIDSAGIEVSNQSMVVPLRLATNADKTLSTFGLPLTTDYAAFDRGIIYLDDEGTTPTMSAKLKPKTLFQAIKGSSSFPVAFAPIKLSYCLRYKRGAAYYLADYKRAGFDFRCPPDFRRVTSYFVDGGVFDNDPIGLVRHLAEAGKDSIGEIRYVNVDPGRRRQPRDMADLEIAAFSQPGDSMEIEMRGGRDAQADEHVQAVLCDQRGEKLEEFTIGLHETGPQRQRFIGVLHTADCACEFETTDRWDAEQKILYTNPDEQIRLFPHNATIMPHCRAQGAEGKVQYVQNAVVEKDPQGLSTQLGFVENAIDSGRNAQLFSEIVSEGWADGLHSPDPVTTGQRPLFQPARLTPLSGEFVASFGAFFDQRFRDFDYFAGVYDAVYGMAEYYCVLTAGQEDCLASAFRSIYFSLCPECAAGNTNANVVVKHLVQLDVCGAAVVTDWSQECSLDDTPWFWAASLSGTDLSKVIGDSSSCALNQQLMAMPAITDATTATTREQNELLAVGRALLCAEYTEKEFDRDPFRAFVQQLAQDPRFDRENNSPIGRMLAKSDRPAATWYYPLASTAVQKLLPLEKIDQELRENRASDGAPRSGAMKTGLALTGLAAESMMADRTGWQPYLGSIPRQSSWSRYAPFVPNEFAVDTRNGGLSAYWEAGWLSETHWSVLLRGAPYQRQKANNRTVEFAELTPFLVYSTNDAFISSGGIGPTYTHTWSNAASTGNEGNWGASAFLGLLGDKLRVTYGVRSFSTDDFVGDDFYWQLSIRDVPGMVFWGMQAQ